MNATIRNIIMGLLLVTVLTHCTKDKGNYNYADNQHVTIKFPGIPDIENVFSFIGEELTIEPALTITGNTSTAFEYQWYVNGVLKSTSRIFKAMPDKKGVWIILYIVKDPTTGYQNISEKIRVVVSSPFDKGFAVLYNDNGKSVLNHIRINGQEYLDYTNIYATINNGEQLGNDPVHIQEYEVGDNGKGIYVLQNGGQGSVELDGDSYKKMLTMKEAFHNTVPAGLSPKGLVTLRTADYLLSADGKLYNRFFQNAIPFTMPWNPNPVNYTGGMKIKTIWDTWSSVTSSTMMYDELHNRLLEAQTDNAGAFIAEMPDADPSFPYPPDFPDLRNMGAHEYIWGGTIQESNGYRRGMVLLKDPVDQQIYFHSFAYFSGFFTSMQPEKRILFTGSNLITPQSKFYAIKYKNYLLFTGGSNNDQLYYYDCETGLSHELYVQTESPITAITGNVNSWDVATIAVGLQNGTTVLYEFSNETIQSGQSKELHRMTHAGSVKSIATRGTW